MGKEKRKKEPKQKKDTRRSQITLRRTAKEAKKSSLLVKALSVSVVALIAMVGVTYAISYFYDKLGSFTIKLNKYDMAKQGISLCETLDGGTPSYRLDADTVQDMYNISVADLPSNLSEYEGSHNGDNYIAYSFYLKNSGSDTISIRYSLDMSNVTNNIDAAIRVRIYDDGQFKDYAKAKPDGTPENQTIPFPGRFVAASEVLRNFSPGDVKKYTIVIWLEGDDEDCVDSVIGGVVKMVMNFKIEESS